MVDSIVLYYYYIELLQLVTDTDTSILLDRVKVARAGEIFAPGARISGWMYNIYSNNSIGNSIELSNQIWLLANRINTE